MEKALEANNLATSNDGWPWPSLLMLGLNILHLTEEKFWSMRPVTFATLIEAYNEYNTPQDDTNKPPERQEPEMTTIDNVSWW